MASSRLAFVCLLLIGISCNQDRVARLERENKALAAKLEAVSKAANLDAQEKCAKQARSEFNALGWDKESMASFENHYSAKVNKCFVLVSNMGSTRKPYVPTVNRLVFDAFEGKGYASYTWMNNQGKKYWEVPPIECTVTSLTGEQKHCTSQEEFDELIKQFMQQ